MFNQQHVLPINNASQLVNIIFSACTTILSSKDLDVMVKIRTLLVLDIVDYLVYQRPDGDA